MGTDGKTEGQMDRQTDVTNLILDFRNFANAPKTRTIHGFDDSTALKVCLTSAL
jgi:hypothetical protein